MPSSQSNPVEMEMPQNQAAAGILDCHRDSLLLFITGKLGPDAAALVPDIWQEVSIAAHRHCFDTRPVEDPLNWLRRVASNKIADHWRKTRRVREADARWVEDQNQGPQQTPFEWVLSQGRRETVRGVLARLGNEDRRLLREKYLLGHTIGEIAEKEGVGVKVIEHRLAEARASFRILHSQET